MTVVVRTARPDEEPSAGLLDRFQRELLARYDDPDDEYQPTPAPPFAPPAGRFLLLEVDGAAAGCAGVRDCGAGPEGTAELKRMYVVPEHRGRGLSRRLLAAAEDAARELGYRTLWLETGTAQPEAMVLYASAGYHLIPNYGPWADSPLSRCYARALDAHGPGVEDSGRPPASNLHAVARGRARPAGEVG